FWEDFAPKDAQYAAAQARSIIEDALAVQKIPTVGIGAGLP
ncbi:hypothetical protein PC118_g25105, partial [Phytophthora cactorum]